MHVFGRTDSYELGEGCGVRVRLKLRESDMKLRVDRTSSKLACQYRMPVYLAIFRVRMSCIEIGSATIWSKTREIRLGGEETLSGLFQTKLRRMELQLSR